MFVNGDVEWEYETLPNGEVRARESRFSCLPLYPYLTRRDPDFSIINQTLHFVSSIKVSLKNKLNFLFDYTFSLHFKVSVDTFNFFLDPKLNELWPSKVTPYFTCISHLAACNHLFFHSPHKIINAALFKIRDFYYFWNHDFKFDPINLKFLTKIKTMLEYVFL